MLYNILKSKLFPAYDRNGERERIDGAAAWRVEWVCVGQCNSMAQAVDMGFRGCALEEMK